jgi:spermidine synthase
MSSYQFKFILSCLILGFTALVGQIVLLREVFISFYGNELSLGILLLVWLFWVGLGALFGNRLCFDKIRAQKNFPFWNFFLGLIAVATILAIRSSKSFLGILPGETVGFFPLAVYSFFAFFPFCFLLGVLFVLNSFSWDFPEEKLLLNRVYFWESAGAFLGGILAVFLLIPHFSNWSIILFLALLNLILSLVLAQEFFNKTKFFSFLAIILLIIFGFKFFSLDRDWEELSLRKVWRNFVLLKSEDSIYGNVAVIGQEEQLTFYESGLVLFSYPNEFVSEEAVHFALAESSHPQKILLIGGGLGGTLKELLKYQNVQVDYVELDAKLISLGKEFLPEEEKKNLEDSRVKTFLKDGRLFVMEKVKKKEKYDVIILNLPDPFTAQINRFYTKEFFHLVSNLLKQEGIFSFRAASGENVLTYEQTLYISSLEKTLASVFPEVKVLPGGNALFLASPKPGILFDDWQKFVSILKERNIQTNFVNEHFLFNRLANERIDYLNSVIRAGEGKINSDLKSISYFYNIVLWGTQIKSMEKSLFLFLYKINPYFLAVIPLLIWLMFLSWRKIKKSKRAFTLAVIFLAGFSSIFLEIIIVLCFQIYRGYIYSKVGLILTAFMLGLAVGSLFMQRRLKRILPRIKSLIVWQIAQVILIGIICGLIFLFSKFLFLGSLIEIFLMAVTWLCGILGGAIFILANQLYLLERKEKIGTGYFVDLLGSALSSLLVSVIFIPLLGLPLSLVMLGGLNLIMLFFLLAS